MRRTEILLLLLVTLTYSFAHGFDDKPVNAAPINTAIDAWHEAAAKADEEKYFSYFATDAVFLGTDPNERWNKEEFRKWAHPHFAKGKAWTMKGLQRHVYVSSDQKTAWFDEVAQSEGLGRLRGSGVLVLDESRWKMAQYNLSIPIPNEKFDKVKKLIAPKKP